MIFLSIGYVLKKMKILKKCIRKTTTGFSKLLFFIDYFFKKKISLEKSYFLKLVGYFIPYFKYFQLFEKLKQKYNFLYFIFLPLLSFSFSKKKRIRSLKKRFRKKTKLVLLGN